MAENVSEEYEAPQSTPKRVDDGTASLSTTNTLLGVTLAILAAGAMKVAAVVLVPFVLAIFVAYLITPMLTWLGRHRVPHVLTLPVMLLMITGAAFLLYLVVAQTVADITELAPQYAERLEELASDVLHTFGMRPMFAETHWIDNVTAGATGLMVQFLGSIINFGFELVLVLTYTGFLIVGRKSIQRNLTRAFSSQRTEEVQEIVASINASIQRYIVTKIALSLLVGFCMFLVLIAWGVDFAVFFGLMGFLLSFIPTLGSGIAALLPIFLSALQFGSLLTVLGVALSLIAVQQIIGNVIEPAVQGRQLNLSPIVILFALIFLGWLWGFWGMVVSVPLVAVLKIVMKHTRSLNSLAIMMEK